MADVDQIHEILSIIRGVEAFEITVMFCYVRDAGTSRDCHCWSLILRVGQSTAVVIVTIPAVIMVIGVRVRVIVSVVHGESLRGIIIGVSLYCRQERGGVRSRPHRPEI